MDDTARALQKTTQGLFPERLDLEFESATPDEVVGSIVVTEALCTTPGVMHGGAIMAMADTLGAYATVMNLPPGAGTTTLESKTNFFNRASTGERVRGTSVPLHRGRRTMVWRTEITREDGRLVAVVTQTQIVLEAKVTPEEQMANLFAKGETADHQQLLARLERSGSALYRAWADQASTEADRAELLAAADREDQNAALLDRLTR